MAGATAISWTEQTWNPIVGCSIVSPGCTNCYAMRDAWRKHHIPAMPHYRDLTKKVNGNAVWTGKIAMAPDSILLAPLKRKKPTVYFVNSMGDLFHEDCPEEWIDRVFAVMALCPQHTFQVLTKRAERMKRYVSDEGAPFRIARVIIDMLRADKKMTVGDDWPVKSIGNDIDMPDDITLHNWPLPNVWLGVSTERQQEADERIPLLLQTPAAVRFVSAEPLLGPIEIGRWTSTCYECGSSCGLRLASIPSVERCEKCGEECGHDTEPVISEGCPKCGGELEPVCPDCGHYMVYQHPDTKCLDWVIVGGESGPTARPMHPDWARSLRDQCDAAGVAFHFKQWGEWSAFYDRDDDDPDWRRVPETDGQMGRGATRFHNLAGGIGFHGERVVAMRNVGKKTAGRLLDGIEHNGFPTARTL